MTTNRLAAALMACLGVTSAWAADEPVTRGVARESDSEAPTLPQYRRQWAVIVGVNYAHLQGAARAEVPALATAENDAQAVYDQLVAHFGYTPETARLLKGAEATRENIRRLFGDGFLGDQAKVTAEDSVLFFFAGHGNRRETTDARDQFVGLLYPHDVHVLTGKGVDTISCLRIDELLGYLRDYCAARHKLVVLDSCHAGEVFNFRAQRSAGVNRGFRANLFREPAFQAIAAARGSQTAADADATGKHSPFTRALLDALTSGPGSADRKLFTASELFSFIPGRVAEMPGVHQDPRGGWIAGDGDFYFFPDSLQPGDLPEREVALLAVRSGPAETRTGASSRPTSHAILPLLLGVGGLVLVGLVGLVGWQWRRRSGQARSSEARPTITAGPVLCLRLVGTPCLYQAPAGADCIRVGRQRRKPGESPDAGNDFVIRSPAGDEQSLRISRQHFEIVREGTAWRIVDRSSSGTLLNGQSLVKDQPQPLAAGDKITVAGVIELEVLLGEIAPRGVAQAELNVTPQAPGVGPLLLQASVGDMITLEPERE